MKTMASSPSPNRESGQSDQLQSTLKDSSVQETDAKGMKKLTSADMWQLQKNSRSASDFFRKWSLN